MAVDFSAERLVALLAALLAAAAMGLAIGALQRVRRQGAGLSPELCLTLVRDDGGLRRLREHSARTERWWVDADPRDLEEIDRALSMWEAVAWNAETGAIGRDSLIGVFGRRIVEVWEQAYPYVQARREQQPALWSSLGELYVDAYDVAGGSSDADRFPLATYDGGATEPDVVTEPEAAITPEPEPEVGPEPAREPVDAVVPAPELAPEPVAEAAPAEAPAESDERLQLWAAALRDEARSSRVVDLRSASASARPRELRRTVAVARAVVPTTALEHVVDVEIHAPAEGADPRG